jgi:hypothetical protein
VSIADEIREALRGRAGRVQSVSDRWSDIERGGATEEKPIPRGTDRILVVIVALLLVVVSVVFLWSAFGPTTSRPQVGPADADRLSGGELVEPMSEREQAEVFAFRAVAATGLMNPFGSRSFGFTYRDDTTRTDIGWRIGFAAMDCEPKGDAHTCRGLSGDDPSNGNALTDTYVTVALDNGAWTVTAVDGNVLDEERAPLVGFSLPEREEPSHWEFPAVDAWLGSSGTATGYAAVALWVGPYPTEARGSVCEVRAAAADGADLGLLQRWYLEPPARSFERGGWLRGGEFSDTPDAMTTASVTCQQYTGRGWNVIGAELERQDGEVVGVRIDLEWQGEGGITGPAECEVEVLNESNEIVWRGRGRAEALWPLPSADKYPYRGHVLIPRPVDNPPGSDHLGSYTCRLL